MLIPNGRSAQHEAFNAKHNAEDPYLKTVPVRILMNEVMYNEMGFDSDFPVSGDHLTKAGAKRG